MKLISLSFWRASVKLAAKFIKFNDAERAKTIFKLYDIENVGYIQKADFVKMLYNYPKEELSKFHEEVFETVQNPNESRQYSALNVTYRAPELFDSHANLNTIVRNFAADNANHSTTLPPGQPNNNLQVPPTNDSPFNAPRRRSEQVSNSIDFSYVDGSKIGNSFTDAGRLKNPHKRRLTANKLVPTNVGNKIILWTDAIYERHGNGDKLTYDGFQQWIEKHPAFLKSFSRYFRPQLWLAYNDPTTNQRLLGYRRIRPALESPGQVQLRKHGRKRHCIFSLYGEFLLVMHKQKLVPTCVVILKGVDITFDAQKLTISVSRGPKAGSVLNFIFASNGDFEHWRKTLETYSRLVNK